MEQDIINGRIQEELHRLSYLLLDAEYRVNVLERIILLTSDIGTDVLDRIKNESIEVLRAKYPQAEIKLNPLATNAI